MLFFGGVWSRDYYDDLRLYHPDTNLWHKLSPTGSGPERVSGHSAMWVERLRGMLVFGGYGCPEYCDSNNHLHLYLPGTNAWQKLKPTGSVPVKRTSHSGVWVERLKGMLIFGGWTSNSTDIWQHDDLYLYLSETNEWRELSPNGTVPQARSHHSAVWIEVLNGMVIFGGDNDFDQFNDMHVYLPDTNEWQELKPISNQWIPSPRRSHSALWVDALKGMLVYGGFECWKESGGLKCGEMGGFRFYDPEANQWQPITAFWPAMEPSKKRAGHSVVWMDGVDSGATGMLLYGGFTAWYEYGRLKYAYSEDLLWWNPRANESYEETLCPNCTVYGDGHGYGDGDHDPSGSAGVPFPAVASLLLSCLL